MTTKLEGGGQQQFLLTTSVACDENPLFYIQNWAGTLVLSGTAANSGDGNYYKFATLPTSEGMYTYNWQYTISANTFLEAGRFEVVQTLVLEADLYCNANQVINMYGPLRDSKLTNSEIDEFIRDTMNLVNGKLSQRYSVPFPISVNSLPPLVETITKNLTLVSIMERKGGDIPEWISKRQERFETILNNLAEGEMTLVLSGGTVIAGELSSTLSQVDHSMANYVPTFNMLGGEYQRIDPDRLDDEEDAL